MSPEVRYSRYVQDDVDEIWEYIEERNSEAANKLIFEIAEKFRMLSRNLQAGTRRDDIIAGLRQFPLGNYNIFYFPIENGVEIYRVLHSSRDTVQVFDNAIDELDPKL